MTCLFLDMNHLFSQTRLALHQPFQPDKLTLEKNVQHTKERRKGEYDGGVTI